MVAVTGLTKVTDNINVIMWEDGSCKQPRARIKYPSIYLPARVSKSCCTHKMIMSNSSIWVISKVLMSGKFSKIKNCSNLSGTKLMHLQNPESLEFENIIASESTWSINFFFNWEPETVVINSTLLLSWENAKVTFNWQVDGNIQCNPLINNHVRKQSTYLQCMLMLWLRSNSVLSYRLIKMVG